MIWVEGIVGLAGIEVQVSEERIGRRPAQSFRLTSTGAAQPGGNGGIPICECLQFMRSLRLTGALQQGVAASLADADGAGLVILPTTTLGYCWASASFGGVSSFSGILLVAIGVIVDLGLIGNGRGAARR